MEYAINRFFFGNFLKFLFFKFWFLELFVAFEFVLVLVLAVVIESDGVLIIFCGPIESFTVKGKKFLSAIFASPKSLN